MAARKQDAVDHRTVPIDVAEEFRCELCGHFAIVKVTCNKCRESYVSEFDVAMTGIPSLHVF
jgi:hypothetical protein